MDPESPISSQLTPSSSSTGETYGQVKHAPVSVKGSLEKNSVQLKKDSLSETSETQQIEIQQLKAEVEQLREKCVSGEVAGELRNN